jgi:hypothetical protein
LNFACGSAPFTTIAAGSLANDADHCWVLKRFWSNARDPTGATIQPESELDGRLVPIPLTVAYRAIEAGKISGRADWCGLDWQSHYLSLTAAARKRGMSDKQVAFFSTTHGAAQGRTRGSLTSACPDPARQRARQMLSDSTKQGLEESNESPERTPAN